MKEKPKYKRLKCKNCKKITEHKERGFLYHNRSYICMECGHETEDWRND